MKTVLNRILLAVLVCALASVAAFGGAAKTREKDVTLPQDVLINGTLLKQGTYKMKFDEQTGELLFIKNKATVAKTTARLEQRQRKSSGIEFGLDAQGDPQALRSISFAGDKQKLVIVDETK